MANATVQRNDVVSGIWKFPPEVSKEDVLKLANEWKNGPEGHLYLRLYVRPCSRGEWGLGFECQFGGRTHELYFHKTAAQLMERFGEIKWDMGSGTTFVVWSPITKLISPGTVVKTRQERPEFADWWSDDAKASRRWGVTGEVISAEDADGLCYAVKHGDGTVGHYAQAELEILL